MEKLQQQPVVESRNGLYIAQRIPDDLEWGVGAIQPMPEFADEAEQHKLLQVVLDSLEEVSPDERAFSLCTDGRTPVQLENGDLVPVREQQVGTDFMTFFHMAEALGERFYKDPSAPLPERLYEVAGFMRDMDLWPSTHSSCGAAGGFVVIKQKLVGAGQSTGFVENPMFQRRQQLLLPEDVTYDQNVRDIITEGYRQRLDSEKGLYDDWSDALITDIVRRVSGSRAIALLHNDGRGQNGHVEEFIVRNRLDGVAINEAKVFKETGGREVFGVNDLRMQRNARMIGGPREEHYQIAMMAAEDFTSGAHGLLGKNLPTYTVDMAA